MHQVQRKILQGTPLARHSMNQRVMKRVRDGEKSFYRANGRIVDEAGSEPRTGGSSPLVDSRSFERLIRSGIYGTGKGAYLEASVHLVASALTQITLNGGREQWQ
jgi:hypothetical protein